MHAAGRQHFSKTYRRGRPNYKQIQIDPSSMVLKSRLTWNPQLDRKRTEKIFNKTGIDQAILTENYLFRVYLNKIGP